MTTPQTRILTIFSCYAHEDKGLRDELERHLGALKRSGQIISWHDRDILPGTEWEHEIDTHLNTANIILLLISPDFFHSDYCYGVEMRRALEKHRAGEARAIAVILRPVDWKETPISELPVLPTTEKPITKWRNRDEAFLEVIKGIREVARTLLSKQWKEEGNRQYKAQNYEVALVAFEQALHLNHNDTVAYISKGKTLFSLKRHDEALVAFEQALHLNPSNAVVYIHIGDIFSELGRYDEALAAFRRVTDLESDETVAYGPKSVPLQWLGKLKEKYLLSLLSLSTLEEHCKSTISNTRSRKADDDQYCVEIFRRAMVLQEGGAWEVLQRCFHDELLGLLRHHPMRREAYSLDSEENYLAQTFERFWRATSLQQHFGFSTLSAVRNYLHASLNGVIVDTLRTYSRSREVPLSELDSAEGPVTEDEEQNELWDVISETLSDEREKRLAYLLFICNLKPRDILRYGPQEFGDVQEIYRLRRNIMDKLLRNADSIRWQLSEES